MPQKKISDYRLMIIKKLITFILIMKSQKNLYVDMMEKKINFILKKSTRKKAKWMVIFLNSLLTIIGTFTGSISLLLLSTLSFWVYVLLDKFNPLTKNTNVNKIVKKDKKINLSKLKNSEFYDNSHESGY